jgi:GH25 family lysozyme M1 (1,4-beta-N-acetylmuramidase)
MATCRGIDVSAYQGTQDWAAHKKADVVFAFAKASEGQSTHDPKFATHITGIIKAGLVPGAYHFAWPTQSAAREAANYIAAVKPYAGKGFTHWLDLERYSDGRNYAGRTAAQIRAWVTTWVTQVQAAFPGQRVGIYTSADDIAAGRVPDGLPLWYPAYPWGAAEYSRAEAAAQPKPSGRTPLIWQFTSQPIDRSIAYMSAADLRAWAAGTTARQQEDDMPLTDADARRVWAYSHGDKPDVHQTLATAATQSTAAAAGIRSLTAQVAALTATVGKLAQGGGLDAAEIKAAAEAGAQAALDKLADALKEG